MSETRIAEAKVAMEFAIANRPMYPAALLEKLGAYMGGDGKDWRSSAQPEFCQWVWTVAGCPNGYIPNNVAIRLDDEDGLSLPYLETADLSDIRYCGMWRGRTQSQEYMLYCIVPSLQHGRIRPGAPIENVAEFKPGQCTQEELENKVKDGWDIMQRMIAEDGPYQPES